MFGLREGVKFRHASDSLPLDFTKPMLARMISYIVEVYGRDVARVETHSDPVAYESGQA